LHVVAWESVSALELARHWDLLRPLLMELAQVFQYQLAQVLAPVSLQEFLQEFLQEHSMLDQPQLLQQVHLRQAEQQFLSPLQSHQMQKN
jgi:hypothetical protein